MSEPGPWASFPDQGYGQRGTTTGSNGSFTDYCDEHGNLVEYSCEPRNCDQRPCSTNADVIETHVDCLGRCDEGACFLWCADFGDTFVVSSIGSDEIVIEHEGGQIAVCAVVAELNGYDCHAQSLIGRTLQVVALGDCNPAHAMIGLGDPEVGTGEQCGLDCAAEL